MWTGRSLARSFFRLQGVFRWRPFSVDSAAKVLALPLARTRLTVSRLARAGWLARVANGTYVALDARWALERPSPDPLATFQRESYYRVLVSATAGVLQFYGARVGGLALFGSAARRTQTSDSDVDLLVIADPLPSGVGERLDEIRSLRRDLRASARLADLREPSRLEAQFVPMTPEELRTEPPILLDMTQDAIILFDPSGLISDALSRLSQKLRARGSRRIVPADGLPYWQLSPGARLGEVREL